MFKKIHGLVTTVSDLISEFKRYNITPEILEEYSPKSEYLKIKLNDLIFIYKKFEERIKAPYLDVDDEFKELLELLKKSSIVKDANIYIDAFDGFTPQEIKIINELEKLSNVTIALTLDDSDDVMFSLNRKTYQKLKKENAIEDIFINEQKRFNNDELKHLEKNYNSIFIEKYNKPTENIEVLIEKSLTDELDDIAQIIVSKVRDNGLRYENIAIITRNIEDYKNDFKLIFEKYNIPFFFDDKHELANQPVIALVNNLIEILYKNFEYEAVFAYLKTGLTNIQDLNDIDFLENYVLEFGIKGNTWLNDWTYGNYDLIRINDLRKRVIEPILRFKNSFEKRKNVKDISKSIYEFLIDINVYNNILAKSDSIKNREHVLQSEIDVANTYIQVWNIFMNLLDELVFVLGDENVSFEGFRNILKQGISTKQIGLIPTSRDQVLIGDVARTRNPNIKVLFVIGLNDGVFPMQYNDEGLINDSERDEMFIDGIEIAKNTKMLLLEENFNIYKVLTTPTDKLYISYPIANNDGVSLRPSEVINSLKRIFPLIKITSNINKCFNYNCISNTVDASIPILLNEVREIVDGKKISQDFLSLYSWFLNNKYDKVSYIMNALNYKNTIEYISKASANNLYGNEVNTSVSKIETFANCPFSFFMKYGLNAKERKIFKLDTPDVGVFLHEIIEKFSKYLLDRNISFRDIEKEEAENIVSNIVDDVLSYFKSNIFDSSNKLKHLSLKLKKLVKKVIWIIIMQIKTSNFEVVASEFEFGMDKPKPALEILLNDGKKVLLNGKIDRIDIAKTDDGKYIRIIDYKSYNKEMKLFNIYSGLEIQLITYMDAVSELESLPGGMLYLKLDDPLIKTQKDCSEEDIYNEIRNSLRMNGMILADMKLIKAMDNDFVQESQNINISLKNDKFSGKTYAVSEDDFNNLKTHVRKVLKELCTEIVNGNIKNEPINLKGKTPCEYCSYKTVCRFDRNLGNEYKFLNEIKKEEIWEQIKF